MINRLLLSVASFACLAWSLPSFADEPLKILARWAVPLSLGYEQSIVLEVDLRVERELRIEKKLYESGGQVTLLQESTQALEPAVFSKLEGLAQQLRVAHLDLRDSTDTCPTEPRLAEGRALSVRDRSEMKLRVVLTDYGCWSPTSVEPISRYDLAASVGLSTAIEALTLQAMGRPLR